ncbi:MAG TPA: flagellar basal body-associated FliL family protein [Acetobacteraceae bacterium]
MAKAEAAEGAADGAAKKGGKKKLLLILVPVLLLGGGAGAWFSGVLPRLLGHGEEAAHGEHAEHGEHGAPAGEKGGEKGGEKAEAAKAPAFMDLPDIVANLNAGRRTAFIKLKAKFELSKPEDAVAIQAAMPRIVDLFQSYLREMRPEELRGTAGTYRLREELIARANIAAPPARVLNVLFSEMLVQ